MSPIATESLSVDFDKVNLKETLRSDEAIVNALTLEEKVSLLSGRSFCDTPGVPRLGVSPIKVSDGPSGMYIWSRITLTLRMPRRNVP